MRSLTNKSPTRVFLISCLAILLGGSGCGFNRRVLKPEGAMLVDDGPGVTQVVVAGLYEGTVEGSSTGSSGIILIKEAAELKEVSREISQRLVQQGVKTAAVSGRAEVAPRGTLLVRGSIRTAKTGVVGTGAFVAGTIISALTLGVIGWIFPLPFAIETTCFPSQIRIETIDDMGNIVGSGDVNFGTQYSSLYVLGVQAACPRDAVINRDALFDAVATYVAEGLRSRLKDAPRATRGDSRNP